MATIPKRLETSVARAIARDAYIFGFPLVDNYRILYSYFVDRSHPEYKGPWNRVFHNTRVCTPGDRTVQTPNSDTPYSHLGADLRAEPLVLTMPIIADGRYFSAQFVDMYTHNFAYLGTRTSGNGGGRFLLAGPRWTGTVPDGISAVIHCETEFAFVLYRTQLRDVSDIDAVLQVQSQYGVQPLSSYLGRRHPPPRKTHFVAPLDVDEERTDLEFFSILNFVLQFCPTNPSETTLRWELGRLGVGAGRPFQLRGLPGEIRRAVEDGMADAWRAYRKRAKEFALGARKTTEMFGMRADLGDDYLTRMVAAVDGIYGNSREEAVYCVYAHDANGLPLDGAKRRYTLRFPPGFLPPIKAFWSLTMYELPTRLLVENQMDRYLINSAMLPQLTRDEDGGITLYIQRNRPSPRMEANWLPAADGPFLMYLRLYWPDAEVLDGHWQAPSLEEVQQVAAARV
jgi:hypothetical protein